jgi:outer membrane receptor for ferrienterochelin and colicin
VTWQTPWDITLTTTWRFIGSSTLDSNSTQPSLTNGIDHVNGKIGDYSYLDLSAAWQADEHVELRAGVTNVFDLDPPILDDGITGSGTPNTFNSYDLLGRSIFVAVTGKF